MSKGGCEWVFSTNQSLHFWFSSLVLFLDSFISFVSLNNTLINWFSYSPKTNFLWWVYSLLLLLLLLLIYLPFAICHFSCVYKFGSTAWWNEGQTAEKRKEEIKIISKKEFFSLFFFFSLCFLFISPSYFCFVLYFIHWGGLDLFHIL